MNTEITETELTEDQQKEQSLVLAQSAMASITNVPEYRKTLSELVERHKDAKFTDLEDKDGIKAVQTAYSETRQARLAVDKLGKNFKGLMKQIMEHGDGQIAELLEIVSPSEKAFKAEKDRIDELKEEAKQELQRQEEEKKQQRTSELVALGATWNGSYWDIGPMSVRVLDITHSSQTQWEGTIAQAKVIYEAEQLRIAEEEEARRKEQEEADRKAEQERAEALREQQRLQAEAEARQKEIDAQNEAMKAVIAERTEARIEKLRHLNFFEVAIRNCWEYRDFIILNSFIEKTDKAEWDAKISAFQNYLLDLEAQRSKKPVPAAIQEIVDQQPVATVNGTEVKQESAVNDEWNGATIDNTVEPRLSYEVGVSLKFSTYNPYIDTKVGKATLRIYVEQFMDNANKGLTPADVSASGSIGDQLLFLVIKPKA